MRLAALLRILAAFLVLGVSGSESLAEDAEPATPSATVHSSEFIAAPQIPEATEILQQTLRHLGESAAQKASIVSIARELPAIKEQTRQRNEQTKTLLASNPSLDSLRDAEADWESLLETLASRRQILARRASGLEDEVRELQATRDVWKRTFEDAHSTGAPGEILTVVETGALNDLPGGEAHE